MCADRDHRLAHLSHLGQLGLIKEVIQSHEEIPGLHLYTLAPSHVTAAATLTVLNGAATQKTNHFVISLQQL